MTGSTITGVVGAMLLFLASGEAQAQDDGFRHMPIIQAEPNTSIELAVELPSEREPSIHASYRPIGHQEWVRAEFTRKEMSLYVVVVPAEYAIAPGLEYFVSGRLHREGEEAQLFASADEPHRILIRRDPKELQEEEMLEQLKGRRSRVQASTEFVSFGTRTVQGRLDNGQTVSYEVPDNYLRVDVDFTYRLVRLPLRSLRFGYTRLVGDGLALDAAQRCFGNQVDADDCIEPAGFKVGGWFELGLSPVPQLALDARGMVLATAEGFTVGARGEARVGDAMGPHLAGGFEYLADVGNTIYARIGWDSVPNLPMALTIAGSQIPLEQNERGVRLMYDIYREFAEGLRFGLRLNYQSRDDQLGGVGGGLSSSFEF